MMTLDQIEGVISQFRGHDSFDCPHCGNTFEVSDPDVSQQVVSYWGDDAHYLSCDECEADFVVRENVTRQFEIAKTIGGLE